MKPNFLHLEAAARWAVGCGAFVSLVSALASQPEVLLGALPKPDLVIAAGTEVMLGGVPTKISGFDHCPASGILDSETETPLEVGEDCIRLTGEWIRIEYLVGGQPKQEVVAVLHDGARTLLRRTDGSPIEVSANAIAAEIEAQSPGIAL